MMTLLQEFWKSFKSLLGIKEPPKEVLKSTGSQEEPKKEAQVPKRQVEKDSAQIIRRKLEKVHLQVGLDFGTHSTKVVYSQIGKRVSRALNFEHNLPNYPNYCLPSVAAIDNHGKLTLGIDAAKLLLDKEWDLGFQRFKVIVAGNYDKGFKDPISHENFYRYSKRHGYDETFTSERLTAIYLAYAMEKARELIETRTEYQNLENNKVKTVFENIFVWGEAIDRAWHKTGKGFDPVRASYELENRSHDQDKRVFAVPEAVAGIASY
jgi:tetrahydromethanopterin S-methyltransferase subunit G